jgi:hypothetical protein
VKLAAELIQEYFQNEEFIKKISEQNGEDFQMMNKMKELANKIKDCATNS